MLVGIPGLVYAGTPRSTGIPQQQQAPASPEKTAEPQVGDDKQSLSDQLIQQILEPLRTGMETQNVKQVLSIFDKSEVATGDIQQQLQAFFEQYNEIRFRYQLLQANSDASHATATTELDMDALPYQASVIPARRSVQMRLRLQREAKGWRVIGFTPADFFSLSNFSRTDVQ